VKKRFLVMAVLALVAAYPLFAWAFQHDHGHDPHAPPPAAHQPQHQPHPGGSVANPHHEAPHAGEHADKHGDKHGRGLAPINWADFSNKEQPPYLAMVINLVVLIGLYYFLGKKPIANALVERRDEIAKQIEEAQQMKSEAEARAKKYQSQLERLEEELTTARAALVEAGKGERDRMVRDAEEKAARMQKDAEFLIEQEMKQLRQDLRKETVDMAVAAAEELLKKRITADDQQRLADEYLKDLARGGPRDSGAMPGGAS
jgi:F-type H+-transporting ATPase subunit b